MYINFCKKQYFLTKGRKENLSAATVISCHALVQAYIDAKTENSWSECFRLTIIKEDIVKTWA